MIRIILPPLMRRLAAEAPGTFDVVTCLEMLEHVPEPARIVAACAKAVRPGGAVFFSTINRNAKSFALAIVVAEYMTGLVPRGTHEYRRLVRPSELANWCRACGILRYPETYRSSGTDRCAPRP